MRQSIRHLILDRDGVLNAEPDDGSHVVDWTQWRWLPGVLEGLARIRSAGVRVSVATNQSCVGRGIITRAQLDVIHAHMLADAVHAGARIDGVFVCPHAPLDSCACRKPAPGLYLAALRAARIEPEATLAVGDDLRDLQAASAAGVPAALVRTGKGIRTEAAAARAGIPVFDDFATFTSALLADSIARVHLGA